MGGFDFFESEMKALMFYRKGNETCSVYSTQSAIILSILSVSTFTAKFAEFVLLFRSLERIGWEKNNCTSTVSDGRFAADANRS